MCKTCTHIKQIYITYQAGWLFWPEIWIFWPKSAKKTQKIGQNSRKSEKFGNSAKIREKEKNWPSQWWPCCHKVRLWPVEAPAPATTPSRGAVGAARVLRAVDPPKALGPCCTRRVCIAAIQKVFCICLIEWRRCEQSVKEWSASNGDRFFFFCSKNSEKYYITCPYCCIFSFVLCLLLYG